MLGTVMHRNDGPILGKQAEHLKKLVTFKTIPVFIWSDFLITIHWGSEYQTSEWQTFISPVFRSSVIQRPSSYYLAGKTIVDKQSAIQITIQIAD